MFLPDVKLWLALAFQSHVHHVRAREWFDAVEDGSCFFCRMTQQGFLRLATNPKAFGAEAVSLSDAWGLYDKLAADPRVGFAEEPANIEASWRGYTQHRSFSPKVWNDAYLVAFAELSSLELATFDKGFAQYKTADCTILTV